MYISSLVDKLYTWETASADAEFDDTKQYVMFGTGPVPSVSQFHEHYGNSVNKAYSVLGIDIVFCCEVEMSLPQGDKDTNHWHFNLVPKADYSFSVVPGYRVCELDNSKWEMFLSRTYPSKTEYADLEPFALMDNTVVTENEDLFYPRIELEVGIGHLGDSTVLNSRTAWSYYYLDAGEIVNAQNVVVEQGLAYYGGGRYYNSLGAMRLDVWDSTNEQWQLGTEQDHYLLLRNNIGPELVPTPSIQPGRYFRLACKCYHYGNARLTGLRLVAESQPSIQKPSKTITWAAMVPNASKPSAVPFLDDNEFSVVITDDIGVTGDAKLFCLNKLSFNVGEYIETLTCENTLKHER